jgi:hypothetical protein
VTFPASLPMSAEEFDNVRVDYVEGVAVALNKPASDVSIVSVTEEDTITTRRRLLSLSVSVETAVKVKNDEVESLVSSVTHENLNNALVSKGITVNEVKEVVVNRSLVPRPERTTTPDPTTTPKSSDTQNLWLFAYVIRISGCGAGILLFFCVSRSYRPLMGLATTRVVKLHQQQHYAKLDYINVVNPAPCITSVDPMAGFEYDFEYDTLFEDDFFEDDPLALRLWRAVNTGTIDDVQQAIEQIRANGINVDASYERGPLSYERGPPSYERGPLS